MSDDITHEWLVERYNERHDATVAGDLEKAAYIDGRIDEFCAQNAVDDVARVLAWTDSSDAEPDDGVRQPWRRR